MNVLFATGSPAGYMLPPILSDHQVICGPDWPDRSSPNGRVLSLATPIGRYDLAAIAAKLPAEQKPDVIVCLVDASWRNLPSNLAAFSCPKILLIADTHHLSSPVVGTMQYLANEPFDRSIFLYDRHHAAFFHAAGFRNLFWLPGLTFPHGDAAVRAARVRGPRASRIAFVGQAGKHHPRRSRLLEALKARNLPVVAKGLTQTESLGFYGSSLLGFNASLNGDLNLRVLEIISTGGTLLTDWLTPESGFDRFFADQRDCLIYRTPEELAERAAHALARPTDTQAIGAAGARWFDENYGEMRRRELFRAIAFDGVAAPEFDFSPQEKTRVFFGGDTDRLLEALIVYEGIQEIHRNEETVRVQIADDQPADLKSLFSTLPRIECTTAADEGIADLTVFNRSLMEQGVAFNASMLWCWNAQPADFGLLARGLAPAGYALASETVALLCQQASPATAPQADVRTSASSESVSNGRAPAKVDERREGPSKISQDSLRALLLDSTTPGFAQFDLRKYIAENRLMAPVIFDWLDDIVREAGLRGISNRLLRDAQELVRQYPSQRPAATAAVIPSTPKSAESFQASIKKVEELLQAGAVREAIAELERAKYHAPNAACVAKADEVLAMLTVPAPEEPVPASEPESTAPENIFSPEERTNILEIIAAYTEDPADDETLGQLRSLQSGLADFLKRTEPGQIHALFRTDFGEIYQELVALQLGEGPTAPASLDLTDAVEAGFSSAEGNGGFDPRPLLTHLLFTSNASRTQKSHVYQ